MLLSRYPYHMKSLPYKILSIVWPGLQGTSRYLDNSPPGQFAPDNSPPIFKQLVPRSFIHYRTKQVPKYMEPRPNIIQIIIRSFIQYQTKYSSFFYPLLSLKIGGELSGVNCPCCELYDIRSRDYPGFCSIFKSNIIDHFQCIKIQQSS